MANDTQESSLQTPVQLVDAFPSLMNTLRILKRFPPFNTGWVLATLGDIAHCLIFPILQGSTDDDLSHALYIARGYLRQHGNRYDHTVPGSASWVSMKEFLRFLRLLHERYKSAAGPITAESPGQPLSQQWRIIDCWFEEICRQAAIQGLFGNHASQDDVASIDAGIAASRNQEDNLPNGQTLYESTQRSIIQTHFIQYVPDTTEIEYEPSGPRIPLSDFSSPWVNEGKVPDCACMVCLEDLNALSQDLVVATCKNKHVFHRDCLDEWVNGAAMGNSNTCPVDREVICQARGRIHGGEIVEESSDDNNEDEEDEEGE